MSVNTITLLYRIAKNKYTGWAIAFILAVILFLLWKGHAKDVAALRSSNSAVLAHLDDHANELCAEVSNAELKTELMKDRMAALLDSVKIKAKSVQSIKYIRTERTIHDTISDIVFADAEIGDYQRQFKYDTKCASFTIDLSKSSPVVDMKINNSLYDINHVVRDKLWGLTFAPRWGKKQLRQTIVSACGDTIRNNYKISLKP